MRRVGEARRRRGVAVGQLGSVKFSWSGRELETGAVGGPCSAVWQSRDGAGR